MQNLKFNQFCISLSIAIYVLLLPAHALSAIKSSNVAGSFYPEQANVLSQMLDGFIAQAKGSFKADVQVMIVPHAGYVYSGQIAAQAYQTVSQHNYQTVVVIAPSHFYSLKGVAAWPKGSFQTPLGLIHVDEELTAELMRLMPEVRDLPEVFNREHALEVQLPFIQRTFPQAKIVPLLMGEPNSTDVLNLARTLNQIIKDRRDILVVASSDMSHYYPYQEAKQMDEVTLQIIQSMDVENFWQQILKRKIEMCGFVPVAVGMLLAKLRGDVQVDVLTYANSGDITGDKEKVVGYSSILFTHPQKSTSKALSTSQHQEIVRYARQVLEAFVRDGTVIHVTTQDPQLLAIQGVFVTLHVNGQLRGCIGHIMPQQPLMEAVRAMTIAAAHQDPRFSPVTAKELKDINIEVSVLSTPVAVSHIDDIVLGRDGVILSDGKDHQGVFLPQVATETGWSKEEFLSQLSSQKAGLSRDAWKDPSIKLFTFTADVFHE